MTVRLSRLSQVEGVEAAGKLERQILFKPPQCWAGEENGVKCCEKVIILQNFWFTFYPFTVVFIAGMSVKRGLNLKHEL